MTDDSASGHDNSPEDTGGRPEEFTDQAFLKAVKELKMATTSRVANQVGCAPRTALHRLRQLEQAGDVNVIEAGEFVWTCPD